MFSSKILCGFEPNSYTKTHVYSRYIDACICVGAFSWMHAYIHLALVCIYRSINVPLWVEFVEKSCNFLGVTIGPFPLWSDVNLRYMNIMRASISFLFFFFPFSMWVDYRSFILVCTSKERGSTMMIIIIIIIFLFDQIKEKNHQRRLVKNMFFWCLILLLYLTST